MKKHSFTAVATALLLLLAACSQDELPTNPENNRQPNVATGTPVTITAGIDSDPETRIVYDVDGEITKVNWSAGAEQFSLCYSGAAAESYLFVKPAGTSPVASAEFACDSAPEITEGTTIYAVYPGNANWKASEPSIEMDLSVQSGNQDGLNRNHLMVAAATVPTDGDLSNLDLSFEHKIAVIKLTLSNDDFIEGSGVSGISMEAVGLNTKLTYNFASDLISADNMSGSKITLTQATIVNADKKATAYITLPPGALSDVKITAIYNGQKYVGTLTDNTIARGSIYDAQVNMTLSPLPTSMQFTIRTTEADQEFAFPFAYSSDWTYTLSVDWGEADGSETIVNSADGLKHTYDTAGEYIITLSSTAASGAQMPAWDFYNNRTVAPLLVSMNTPLLRVSGTTLKFTFSRCTNLEEIVSDLFDNNAHVESFSFCFYECTSLSSIPDELFKNNTEVTDFSHCFRRCTDLSSIPTGLFDANIEVTDFSACFFGCFKLSSIPAELFKNNAKVTNFSSCFLECAGLLSIPTELFKTNTEVTDFSACFNYCTRLSSIPAGLFDTNTEVTDFSGCFSGCSRLLSIPTGLFKNNTKVTDFSDCFSNCSQVKLNYWIFYEDVTDKESRFAGKVMNFNNCFYSCATADNIRDRQGGNAPTLWQCKMDETSTYTQCFTKSTKLTNYSSIGVGWK